MLNRKTSLKLAGGILTIIVLCLSLVLSTFALVYASVSVDNNFFKTGIVKINLNNGERVISEKEFIFEPGMTVYKDFFVENESTWDVYYRLYFEEISGGLSEVLEITITDSSGENVLYKGTPAELIRANVTAADDTLKIGERRYLKIFFHFPEDAGNSAQGLSLSFSLCAEAVQTKNNPYKLFD